MSLGLDSRWRQARGKSMLARSVMIVVFVLDELISLGRSQPDGRRFS